MNKLKIAVIFGGISSEYEVSLLSAKSVIDNIPKEKYEIIMLGITKCGSWLHYTGSTDQIADGSWVDHKENTPAFISPNREIHGIVKLSENGAEKIRVDAVFPVLHGANGEDGTIQGLFTLAGIPFVGCDTASSAVCMDKALTKMILQNAGINQAKWCCYHSKDLNNTETIGDIENSLKYPVFIKPANAGSSVGISKAANRNELLKAIEIAAVHDKKIVFEEAVTGREIECAVLGNHEPQTSVCGEIIPSNEFYDYEAKYKNSSSRLIIPAQIPQEKADEIRGIAVKAFKLLGCKGMARIDFFIREDGVVLLNEPNTIPGFTSISMYPKLFEATGIPYATLLDNLINLALEN